MKFLLSSSFLFFSLLNSFGYLPTLETGNQWDIKKPMGLGIEINNSYFVGCDTTINNQTFKKIIATESKSLLGIYREDVENQKIYKWNTSSKTEQLIIDYDLEVGETFEMDQISYDVDSIKTKLIYGTLRRVIYLNELLSFIEGVGNSMYGVHTFQGFQKINDFSLNNNDCLTTSLEDFYLSKANIYPNPSLNYFIFSNAKMLNKKATISNAYGEVIKHIEIQENNDVSDLPSGIYFLKLNENQKLYKLVKR